MGRLWVVLYVLLQMGNVNANAIAGKIAQWKYPYHLQCHQMDRSRKRDRKCQMEVELKSVISLMVIDFNACINISSSWSGDTQSEH